MVIVDAQVHTWTTGTPAAVHRQLPFTNDMLSFEMDAAGVDRAVLVPPSWDPTSLAHADQGARQYPDRFVVMGGLPLEYPIARDMLSQWRQKGRLGLRLTFATQERRALLTERRIDWLWSQAETEGIPIMLAIWGELGLALAIAERYPGLRLIIDHLGIAVTHRTVNAAAFADMPAVMKLSRFRNVAIKASGIPAHSTEPYPYHNLHAALRQVFDAYGPDRTFWGSDLTRMPCSYRACVTMFTEELPWLTRNDLEQVMGRALCKWIGWPLPPDT